MINNLRNNPRQLVREAIAVWLVLNTSVVLFVIIALLFSSVVNDQEYVIIMAFFITAIFTVRVHILLYKRDYYLLKSHSNSISCQGT